MENIKSNILIIANGRSKKLKKLERLLLSKDNRNIRLLKTTYSGEAEAFAKENALNHSHIIAFGGDGTIHEVVNGIMAAIGDLPGPVVGIIPAGTANDFAKTLQGPQNLNQLLELIEKQQFFSCDIGAIKLSTEAGEKKKYFINIADAGIGYAVVDEVNKQIKHWNPNVTFFRAIVKAFRRYHNISVECKGDDFEWSGRMKMLAAANGKFFGNGLMIAPHASLTSGKLALTIGANISTYDYIRYLPTLKRGQKIGHPQVIYKETSTLKITSSEKCGLEADGELLGFAPVEINIMPGRLRFLK